MNSSHLVNPLNTHQQHNQHHNSHHPLTNSHQNNNNNNNNNTTHNFGTHEQQYAGLSGSHATVNKSNNSMPNTQQNYSSNKINNLNNVGAGLLSAATATSSLPTHTTTTSYKFAPARRLAARQTLRLAIPKQPGDSQHSQLNSTAPANTGYSVAAHFKHASPSQLPPAPILKRTGVNTATTCSLNSHIPKSASPLESHNLPNVLHHSNTPICTATSASGSSRYLRARNPSITLNSADDLFSFTKEFSSPAMGGGGGGDHSPIFGEITSSISPSTASSGSPTNHLSRLFNLSPSTLRNYGN